LLWRHAYDLGTDCLQLLEQIFKLLCWHIDRQVTMDHRITQLHHLTEAVGSLVFDYPSSASVWTTWIGDKLVALLASLFALASRASDSKAAHDRTNAATRWPAFVNSSISLNVA
jgi:hypothetical protein